MAEEEKLSAAQRSRIRRLAAPRELAPDEEGGELNIVPFLDIVTNVLMFVLATVSVTFLSTIDTAPPSLGGGSATVRPPTAPTLGLTITLVPDGFSVKARGGNVAPGCNDTGPGLALTKKTGPNGQPEYDYAGLTSCVIRLKHLSSEFKEEMQATVSANPEIPYQAIVSTLDAIRKDDSTGEDLFPDVQFGVAR